MHVDVCVCTQVYQFSYGKILNVSTEYRLILKLDREYTSIKSIITTLSQEEAAQSYTCNKSTFSLWFICFRCLHVCACVWGAVLGISCCVQMRVCVHCMWQHVCFCFGVLMCVCVFEYTSASTGKHFGGGIRGK